ncbi:MAG: hypothetical protein ACJ748_15610 [Flavisolibacter sp.]
MKEKTKIRKEIRMIVVENNKRDQILMTEMFAHRNWEQHVTLLKDIAELIDVLENTTDAHLPSLIVLNANLSRVAIQDALQLLKKDDRYGFVPVAVYGESLEGQLEDELLDLGAEFCRQKPSTIEGMNSLVNELVEYTIRLRDKREKLTS